jgi:hypothetical protein
MKISKAKPQPYAVATRYRGRHPEYEDDPGPFPDIVLGDIVGEIHTSLWGAQTHFQNRCVCEQS